MCRHWYWLVHFCPRPYAGKLAETLDFDQLVRDNLELLIAGEALKLKQAGEP